MKRNFRTALFTVMLLFGSLFADNSLVAAQGLYNDSEVISREEDDSNKSSEGEYTDNSDYVEGEYESFDAELRGKPSDPNEQIGGPGDAVPITDGIPVLLMLAGIYGVYCFARKKEERI